MLAVLRAGLFAVPLFLAAIFPTFAADKAFQRFGVSQRRPMTKTDGPRL